MFDLIRRELAQAQADAWVIYDFGSNNPAFVKVAGRCFTIWATGEHWVKLAGVDNWILKKKKKKNFVPLLRYNWYIISLKCTIWWFDAHIYCEVIATIWLNNTFISLHSCLLSICQWEHLRSTLLGTFKDTM